MLAIKNKILLWKLKHLVNKRNKAYLHGDYDQAVYYGDLVNHYIDDGLHLEEGAYL